MPILGNPLQMGGLGSSVTLESYLASLPFLVRYRMRQTSGTNEPNVGSLGSGLDMTITSTTLGQTGKLGANEAYLFDGASSRLQTPNNATLAGKTTWEYVFLVNPSSAGEGGFGAFARWGDGAGADGGCGLSFGGSLASLSMSIYNTTPTIATTTTTTGLSAAAWALLFVAFDNAGDRKIHAYKGISGAVAEYAYGAQPALTGTYKAATAALNLFNQSAQNLTFAGLADFAGVVDGNLTPAQRTQITLLAGV